MMRFHVSRWLATTASLGLLLPAPMAHGATPLKTKAGQLPAAEAEKTQSNATVPAVQDVALQQNGTLKGSVVDTAGVALEGRTVIVGRSGKQVASASTDAQGRFAVDELPGGVYQLSEGAGIWTYRLWADGSAPPNSRPAALIVEGSQTVRGQRPIGDLFCSDPFIITAVIVAAVAIPVAIHNSQKKAGS